MTKQVYEWTGPTGVKFRDVAEPSGTYYHDTTPRPVIDALEQARDTGAKVRLFLGDRKTGKEWFEENDVYGTIGRSTGRIHIPILVHTSRSTGGDAILCDCIVRLFVNGREVYRHPQWEPCNFVIRTINSTEAGYTHVVAINRKDRANFKSHEQAKRWISFMRGERMCK